MRAPDIGKRKSSATRLASHTKGLRGGWQCKYNGWSRLAKNVAIVIFEPTNTNREGKRGVKKKRRNDMADELVGIITVSKAGAIPKKGNAEHSETGAHSYFV